MRRSRWHDRGSSAVEFALILPLLLTVLFGIVDFGRLQFERVNVSAAAIEGARASLYKGTVDTITATAQASAGGLSILVDTATSSNLSCSVAGSPTSVQVKRPSNFVFYTPILRWIQVRVAATGVMKCLN